MAGMLGHGNRTSVPAPRVVAALAKLAALDISCGGYHTACIATDFSEISYIRVPMAERSKEGGSVESPSAGAKASDRFKERESNEQTLTCGSLYTWGLGKAGQLVRACESIEQPLN